MPPTAAAASRLPPASVPQLVRSDSSASNSSSSTDTSEEEERQRQEALGDAAPSVAGPIGAALGILLLLLLVQSAGAWLFTKGFLLTRTTLEGRSVCAQESARASWTPPLPASGDVRDWARTMDREAECTLPPSHDRALLFIIDALRYDFIAPPPPVSSPTWRASPYYHDVLRAPHVLHAASESTRHLSFLAHFMADAPTTTLQRLKALTTGTLPTFIDAGANFAGSEIDEDSWLAQLRAASNAEHGKARMGFMGDDTWTAVFPRAFDANWTWAYDSFNVEDLDSVDAGVAARLLPFLEKNATERPEGADDWKLLVAHALGVDHVGHRFGAAHASMKTKLLEMEALVSRVVDGLPDDALFVLMGDHGMDQRGDHGGDGELEVGAGLWVYSKSLASGSGDAAFADEVKAVLQLTAKSSAGHAEGSILSHVPFSPLPSPPYARLAHRSVTQIDVVPSLALLLGVGVPFNNLGLVIPELFPPTRDAPDRLLRATRINARQVHAYLAAYAARSRDLEPFADELERAWESAMLADLKYVRALRAAGEGAVASLDGAVEVLEARIAATVEYAIFTRTALLRARSVWAQFELAKMALGLAILALSIGTLWQLRSAALEGLHMGWEVRQEALPKVRGAGLRVRTRRLPQRTDGLQSAMRFAWRTAARGAGAGSAVALSAWALKTLSPAAATPLVGLSCVDLLLAGSSLGAQLSLLYSQASRWTLPSPSRGTLLALALTLAHGVGFGSVYFVIWEDFFVLCLLLLPLMYRAGAGYLYALTPKLRRRIVVLALGSALALRLAAFSRTCREEQAPRCSSTFYDSFSSGASLNSPYALGAAYAAALLLPSLLGTALAQSKANVGVAPVFLRWIATPALLLGAGYWLVDWAAPSANLNASTRATLEWLKLAVARADLALVGIIGTAFWIFSPLCLDLRTEDVEGSKAAGAPPPPTAQGQDPAQPPQVQKRVIVIGFANSLGSSYLLAVTLLFALLFLLAQPMGQLVLSVGLLVVLALAELGDTERDAALLRARLVEDAKAKKGRARSKDDEAPAPGSLAAAAAAAASAGVGAAASNGPPPVVAPAVLEAVTLGLLGSALFFATGHQATFPTIQWRVAFVGLTSVAYPFSPLFVILNTFGPLALLPAFAAPLLALWNLAPRPRAAPNSADAAKARAKMHTVAHVLATSLALLAYYAIVALAAAFFAGWFRRHLMLFKLWTPRFMTSLAALATAYVGSAAGVVAVGVVAGKVATTFGSTFE